MIIQCKQEFCDCICGISQNFVNLHLNMQQIGLEINRFLPESATKFKNYYGKIRGHNGSLNIYYLTYA